MEKKQIVMKPTKQATYLENLRKERNYYKENWEETLAMINAEIERIRNLIALHKKQGKLTQMAIVSSQYELKFLLDLKEKLGKKLK